VKLEVLPDATALAERAARWMREIAEATSGRIAVALSGGSTPRLLYRTLAGGDFPWARTHWFFGDERFVPPDDPQSNFGMAREAMLSRAPAANIHPVPTVGLTPDTAAERYERQLHDFFGAARPLFDIVLLGLGADGHTASLFPGSAVLDERTRWVRATENGRITLTYPALESAAHAAFLVAGAEKHAALTRLIAGDGALPAARLVPEGELVVFADGCAAGGRRD